MNMLLKSILFISCLVAGISGHGRLLDPPARSSAWREDPVRFPMFYDDNQMFCGGFFTQWTTHKGKCGICGDEYGKELFTKGGADYRGFIVRSYTSGELIQITVEVTANHLGYFEFRLCNTDKLGGQDASQECLDKTIIGDKFGKKRFNIGTQLGKVRFQLRLPSGFVCNHCVFQWKYNAGNSWNVDPVTQKGCVGCGPQEQFYGCSDISIKPKSKRSELTPISGYISERKLQDQDQYGEESSVKVPEKILKKLVSELKRLREMESRFIQREVEVNRREENGEFEERSEPIGDENESNDKRDAIIFPNDQSREKIAPPYEAEIR